MSWYSYLSKRGAGDIGLNSTENFSQSIQDSSFDASYDLPGHLQSRCGCFACRNGQLAAEQVGLRVPRDAEPWEFEGGVEGLDSRGARLSSAPANTGFYAKTDAE